MNRFTPLSDSNYAASESHGVRLSLYSNGEANNAHSKLPLAAVLKRATVAIRLTAMASLLAAISLTAACGSSGGGGGGSSGGGAGGVTASSAGISSAATFSCTFANSPTDCGFGEQAKVGGRASIVNIAREGSTAVRLHTEPGDNNVTGSGTNERNDLSLSQEQTDGYEGREAWWAHSILFPDDFVVGPNMFYVVADFHNTSSGDWQANFHTDASRYDGATLHLRGYGGVNSGDNEYQSTVGAIVKNVWYDFVYHVKWSSGADGYFDAWVNGVKTLSHRGPTLYSGQGVYLKLANYHEATGQASSVIHDRIVRGSTALSVSSGPLEGVLTLVNGVLTPVQ